MRSGCAERADRWVRRATLAATVVSAAAVVGIVAVLAAGAVRSLASGGILAVVRDGWRPFATPGEFGIGPMIVGSFLLATSALVLALPAAIGICALAHGLAPARIGRALLRVVQFMTSIPTVVYGFVSVALLVPLVREGIGRGTGFSLLTATLTLAVLVLPTIVLVVDVSLRQVDPGVRLACTALGMTPTQRFLRIMLPMSRRGVAAAAVLGFCRGIGDTLVSLMVAGNAAQVPASPLDSIRTLTAHIALVLATDIHSPEYRSVATAGAFLFVMTAALTFAIRRSLHASRSEGGHAQAR